MSHIAPETPTSIYALTDPRDGAIRYIGRTIFPLTWRLSGHISARDTLPPKNPKRLWHDELLALGLRPGIVLLTTVPFRDARAVERRTTQEHYAAGAALLNVRNGVPCILWGAGRREMADKLVADHRWSWER